jgi:glucosylglycerate synthase
MPGSGLHRPEPDAAAAQIADLLRAQPNVDIVVGLPSYNNAGTIAGVAEAVRQGLAESFPENKAIIVNVDGGSSDGTLERVAELQSRGGTSLGQVRLAGRDFLVPYHGIAGKAEALHVVLQVARQTGARLCLMLSPDFSAFPSGWVERLASPILQQGCDLVLPLYLRHKLDGGITSSIVRPLVRSLYGHRLQQPMGSEYAFSAALVERYLAQNVWGTDLARFGSDIWTTTQAMCGAFKMCHVHLGPKSQVRSSGAVDLGTTLSQVLGALFEDMTRNAPVWQRVRGSAPVSVLGAPTQGVPAAISFDFAKLTESFRLGLRNLQDVWALVLAPATLLSCAARPSWHPRALSCRTCSGVACSSTFPWAIDFALSIAAICWQRSYRFTLAGWAASCTRCRTQATAKLKTAWNSFAVATSRRSRT